MGAAVAAAIADAPLPCCRFARRYDDRQRLRAMRTVDRYRGHLVDDLNYGEVVDMIACQLGLWQSPRDYGAIDDPPAAEAD